MATQAEEPDPRLQAVADRVYAARLTGGSPAPATELLDEVARSQVDELVAHRCGGLGPLRPFLVDRSVDEVMVTGTGPVYVERDGLLLATDARFESETALRATIERILGQAGRRADETAPYCDARLADGSRVNVVLPPLAVDGPVLTIRRFRSRWPTAEELVQAGSWPAAALELVADAVRDRRSILVSGGTGAGKTTVLSALAGLVDPGERVIVIEDTTELAIALPHVVRLQARPSNVEGRGAITIHDLVRNALRMRPDRLIVGEVRGREAVEMVTAMTTGHDGSFSTIHASSARGALERLKALCVSAGGHGAVVAEQIAEAIDLVVHLRRDPGGSRRLAAIAEVGVSGGALVARPLYADARGAQG